ncbi:MAG: MFS transporter, partial [Candidatus Caldarchaeum sp.]|nr:MFS transporter [Candidatus Caldarchaeum sp.]
DRKPVYRLMPAGLLLGGLSVAAVGLLENYYLIFAAAVLGGVGSALYHPVATSLSSVSGKRSMSVSVFMTGGDLGLALGSLVCTLAVALLGLSGTVVLLLMPLTMAFLLTRLELQPLKTQKQQLGDEVKAVGLRSIYLLVGASVLRGLAVMSMITYLPLYLASQGYALTHAGGGLTLMLLAGAGGMITAGFLATKLGKKRVVTFLLLAASLTAFLTPLTPSGLVLIPVSLFGFVALAAHPLLVAISHDMLPNNLGVASALIYGFTFGVVNVLVPVVGLAIDIYGYTTVLTAVAFFPLLSALFASRIPTRKMSFRTAG